jgi:hypothetical protein
MEAPPGHGPADVEAPREARADRAETVALSAVAREIHLRPPTLKEKVADRVLDLFSVSLRTTLLFAGGMVAIDALFIWTRIITPEQRLMTGTIVMTFVSATVVQIGAAIAAITAAVFKSDAKADAG